MIITALRRARKPPGGLIPLIFRALGGRASYEPPEQGRELVGHVRDAVGEPRRVLDGYEFDARELEAGRFCEDGHGEARAIVASCVSMLSQKIMSPGDGRL